MLVISLNHKNVNCYSSVNFDSDKSIKKWIKPTNAKIPIVLYHCFFFLLPLNLRLFLAMIENHKYLASYYIFFITRLPQLKAMQVKNIHVQVVNIWNMFYSKQSAAFITNNNMKDKALVKFTQSFKCILNFVNLVTSDIFVLSMQLT